MEDYSHCYLFDNKRECIAFDCSSCRYKKEHDELKHKVELDEELFEV